MANYQLGPVIGKIGGGAEVQKIPVNIVADGDANSVVIMHTVHVPEGETWFIALVGDLDPTYTGSRGPELSIGELSIGPGPPAGRNSFVAEVAGTAEISLKRNHGGGTDDFSGHAYIAPMP